MVFCVWFQGKNCKWLQFWNFGPSAYHNHVALQFFQDYSLGRIFSLETLIYGFKRLVWEEINFEFQ